MRDLARLIDKLIEVIPSWEVALLSALEGKKRDLGFVAPELLPREYEAVQALLVKWASPPVGEKGPEWHQKVMAIWNDPDAVPEYSAPEAETSKLESFRIVVPTSGTMFIDVEATTAREAVKKMRSTGADGRADTGDDEVHLDSNDLTVNVLTSEGWSSIPREDWSR